MNQAAASEDAFDEPRAILVVTDEDELAQAALAALDQLTWPARRARSLSEAAGLCQERTWELILLDARFSDRSGRLPPSLRDRLNDDTPWLAIAQAQGWHRTGEVLSFEGASTAQSAALIDAEIEHASETRLLSTARLLVGAPGRTSAVPLPPALAAANRLDWMYANNPVLEEAARVVECQEHLAKHVVRLAHALSGDSDTRSWHLDRVLLELGLLRFIPMVKVVAARAMFPVRDPARRQEMEAIWRFSVARAIAMRALAASVRPGVDLDWRHAFDAGLFADAGASLLIWLLDQNQAPRLRTRGPSALSPQLAAFHEWLGERLLDRWKQWRPVASVAGGHHVASAVYDPTATRALALAATMLVEDAGVGPDPSGTPGGQRAAEAFERLAISRETRSHVSGLVRVELERVEEAFV